MRDITTLQHNILRDLHLDTTTSGTQAVNDIKRAAIDAMTHMENEAFWFLREEHRIDLVTDIYEYQLPDEYLSIEGDVFYCPDNTDVTARYPITVTGINNVKANLSTGLEWETTVIHGAPSLVAVDAKSKTLFVAPTPASDDTCLIFDISVDGGVPWYKHDGTAWAFYYKDSTTSVIPSTFTNFWLKEAYNAVRYRTCFQLLIGPYGGSDEATQKSQMYNNLFEHEINRLRGKQNKLMSVKSLKKHL